MNMEKHWEDQPSRGDGTRAERLRRFKGVGVAFEERALEVELEFEMELGLIHPLASLVMDSVRVLMEDRVLEDVRDSAIGGK